MRTYCTIFDYNYLPRGLALYESLKKGRDSFIFWILCLDDKARAKLQSMNLPQVRLLGLEDLEKSDPELLTAKGNRSALEYCFTCKAPLVLHIFNADPSAESITYLDGDIYYFSDPAPVDAEIGDGSIAITPHGFPPKLQDRLIYGKFNAGWIWFRRDENALACLEWWRKKCLEWCHCRCEPGCYTDQKYLDQFSARFRGVKELDHPGCNVALWNIASRRLSMKNGCVHANDRPVIFYHFHALKQISPTIFDPNLAEYDNLPNPELGRHIYRPHIAALKRAARMLGFDRKTPVIRHRVSESESSTPRMKIKKRLQLMRDVLKGKYVHHF